MLGGPGTVTGDRINECCAEMVAFVRLVHSSLNAEFPSWEAWSAFAIFDLTQYNARVAISVSNMSAHHQACLAKLAQMFVVPLDELIAQFCDLLPAALATYTSVPGLQSFECWRRAYLKTRKHHPTRQQHPAGSLAIVLQGFCIFRRAWTSGVER